ncbi:hypothetical protein HPB48_007968 [Haemaphysalis longicornis]|uniref:Uncharacterized protein n=1 Tax=Haemaphysalis longicornis TaxID=44386 RepID=A0A9J6GLK2_HAELO|nr:hypothetical protein HPB48_007968 [Haemaphysalis longicornis]
MFSEKALSTVNKNFRQVSEKPKKIKEQARSLLLDMNLPKIASQVKKAKGIEFQVFFSVETHKFDYRFRKGDFQVLVSSYLQTHLGKLNVNDPFRVRNSATVINYLKIRSARIRGALCIDVEVLYCSTPRDQVLSSVKECISEHNDEQVFGNGCGITVEAFLETAGLLFEGYGLCLAGGGGGGGGSVVCTTLRGLHWVMCSTRIE